MEENKFKQEDSKTSRLTLVIGCSYSGKSVLLNLPSITDAEEIGDFVLEPAPGKA